jgi:hypothetical protein
MDHSYAKLGHLVEKSYVEWTWCFVSEYGMRLADDLPDFPQLHSGDDLLMQRFLRAGYAGKELKQINECWLYLQVFYVSEVLTGCGTKLDVQAVCGMERMEQNKYSWPNQGRPSDAAWTLWKEALIRSLGASPNDEMKVEQPVDHWTVVPTWLWWFYDPRCDQLYEQDRLQWFFWSRTTAVHWYHARQPCDAPILLDLQPATVHHHGSYQCLTGSSCILLELEDAMEEEWHDALQMPPEFLWLT